jgi:cysteine desulfurase/selenocysteine lyase
MNCRDDFPLIKHHACIYLDSAATAQKPLCVIEAMRQFYAEEYGTVHRAIYFLASKATERYSLARIVVQKFLHAASSNEIIFTKGTTEGINLVAASFGSLLAEGDEIIISEMEHHSNIVPWQLLAERNKLVLKVIPMDERGELVLEEYKKLLTTRTKLVAVGHISNVTGTVNPVEEIIQLAHAYGAKVLIDGAQSAPHMRVDVQAMDADFFVFSGHKAFGPTGVGVLYGKLELLQAMPPYQGGGDMITTVTLQKTTYQMPPLRFEAGTPMIAEVMGLAAALEYLNALDLDKICAWEKALLEYATERLLFIPGLRILGTASKKGAIITFVINGVHPLDLGTLLDAKGFAIRTGHLCAQPALRKFGVETAARISFAPYNTFAEIDLFISALKETLLQIGHNSG